MTQGLTDAQRDQVLKAATTNIIELLTEHPEVAKLPVGTVTTVFLAGVAAGVDALDGVLKEGLANWPGGIT